MLFDAADRAAFFRALGASPDLQARAAGWALAIAVSILANTEGAYAALARKTLHRLLTSNAGPTNAT